MCRYPQRVENHSLETESERYFSSNLPQAWTSEKPINDYGVDQRVEISNESNAIGLEFLVQLKASKRPANGVNEKIRLKVSTYNYLWDKLQVVMLVKYIRSEERAYWILLSDVPAPNQNTFTINIPKSNLLSDINWNSIYGYVRDITHRKLSVRERGLFRQYVR